MATSRKSVGLKPMAIMVGKKAIGDARVEKMFQNVADGKKAAAARKPPKAMAVKVSQHRRKTDEDRRAKTAKGLAKRKRMGVLKKHLSGIVKKVKRIQGKR
jgi:hypothetical protein